MNMLSPIPSEPRSSIPTRRPEISSQAGAFESPNRLNPELWKQSTASFLNQQGVRSLSEFDVDSHNLGQTAESLSMALNGGNPWTLRPTKKQSNVNVSQLYFDSLEQSLRLDYLGSSNLGATRIGDAEIYDYSAAEFELVGWLFHSIDDVANGLPEHVDYVQSDDDQYASIRKDLQEWFAASVDDLARILDISPTTIVNLSKPGRSVRTKTVRKLRGMHGLLSELQRVIGQTAALSWARSVGRRMLLDGDMEGFEQFVNSRLFPTVDRQSRIKVSANVDETELVLAKNSYVGRVSRL